MISLSDFLTENSAKPTLKFLKVTFIGTGPLLKAYPDWLRLLKSVLLSGFRDSDSALPFYIEVRWIKSSRTDLLDLWLEWQIASRRGHLKKT